MDDVPVFLPVIFVFFGLGFTALGVYVIIDYIRLKKYCTEFGYGTVVGYEVSKRSNSKTRRISTYYEPIISYSVNGVEYKRNSNIGRETPQYAEGEKLEIAYNPNDPQKFYLVKDKTDHKVIGIIVAFVGLGVTVAGIAVVVSLLF